VSATVPYWQDEPYTARPPLEGDRDVDVCIVGAGVGGLATAWQLAERGIRPLVLEGREVASGASGRNGGFFIAGTAPMYNDARRLFGADVAWRLHAATLAAQQEVYALAQSIGAASHFRRVGMLRLAVDEHEAEHVREHVRDLHADGFPGELVPTERIPPAIRRPDRIGLFTAHDASVHPTRWLRTLARALEARGVTIHEGSAVESPLGERDGEHLVLRTPGGRVRARRVVAAADGDLGRLVSPFHARVRPVRLHMVATAPVEDAVLPYPVYARSGYEYMQQLEDGRIALGGFRDVDPGAFTESEEPDPTVMARLERYLVDELGVVVPVTHRWVGVVGYTGDERPLAGHVPGVPGLYALGGYCGSGNVNGWVAGRIVADLIANGQSPDEDLLEPDR
jgi:glycine/D-amino acid oxidase-like deaminating enzyme